MSSLNPNQDVTFDSSIVISYFEGGQQTNNGVTGQLRFNQSTHKFEGYNYNSNINAGADIFGNRWRPITLDIASNTNAGILKVGNNLIMNPITGVLSAIAGGLSRIDQLVITVSPIPGAADYQDINTAIHTAIGTPGGGYLDGTLTSNLGSPPSSIYPFIIQLGPGQYSESTNQIILPDYVSLRGEDNYNSVIIHNTGNVSLYTGSMIILGEQCEIANIVFNLSDNSNSSFSNAIYSSDKNNISINNCIFTCNTSINTSETTNHIYMNGGLNNTIENCQILMNGPNLLGTYTAIDIYNTTPRMINNKIDILTPQATYTNGISLTNCYGLSNDIESVIDKTYIENLILSNNYNTSNTLSGTTNNGIVLNNSPVVIKNSEIEVINLSNTTYLNYGISFNSSNVLVETGSTSNIISFISNSLSNIGNTQYNNIIESSNVSVVNFATLGFERNQYILVSGSNNNDNVFRIATTPETNRLILDNGYNLTNEPTNSTLDINIKALYTADIYQTKISGSTNPINNNDGKSNYIFNLYNVINQGGPLHIQPSNTIYSGNKTITVGSQNCDYYSISTALSSISNNNSNNRYKLLVSPGTYNELNSIICKDYVDIEGSSKYNTFINVNKVSFISNAADENTASMVLGKNMKLSDMTITNSKTDKVIGNSNEIFGTSDSCNALSWNGSLWVAGAGYSNNNLAYSTDGITWNYSTNGNEIFDQTCNALASNGNIFVAGGDGQNPLAYSTDGINWLNTNIIDYSPVNPYNIVQVLSNPVGFGTLMSISDDGKTCIVSDSTNVYIYYSSTPSLGNYNLIQTINRGNIIGIAISGNGQVIVFAVGYNYRIYLYYSTTPGVSNSYTPFNTNITDEMYTMYGIRNISFSTTGQTLVIGGFYTEILYVYYSPNPSNGEAYTIINTLYTYDYNYPYTICKSIAVSGNGQIIASGYIGSNIFSIFYSSNISLDSSYNGVIGITNNTPNYDINGNEYGNNISLSTSGEVLAISSNNSIYIYYTSNTDGSGYTLQSTIEGSEGENLGNYNISLSGSGQTLLVGSYNSNIAYSYYSSSPSTPNSYALINSLTIDSPVNWVFLSSDGQTALIGGSSNGTVNIFNNYYNSNNFDYCYSLSRNNNLWLAGGNGILYSYDGINWKNIISPPFLQCYGLSVNVNINNNSNSNIWVACGDSSNPLAYSHDGFNWLPSNNGNVVLEFGCNTVAWNGSLWVAGGSANIVLNTLAYSNDGITWFSSTNGNNNIFYECYTVTWNGNIWLAGGYGPYSIAYSNDGKTWYGISSGTLILGECFTISSNNNMTIAGGYRSDGLATNNIAYSYNGLDWLQNPNNYVFSKPLEIIAIAYNGILYIGGSNSNNILAYSYNGFTWYPSINGNILFYKEKCKCITWYNNLWVAGFTNYFMNSTSINKLAYSIDGINWEVSTSGSSILNYSCDAIACNGLIWVAGGQGINNTILYSYNGIDWFPSTNGNEIFTHSCNTIVWNGTIWVIGGGTYNTIIAFAYSYDGITWIESPINNDCAGCYAIYWNGFIHVAGGVGNNTLFYSSDGINWNSSTNGNTIFYSCFTVIWNGKIWVAGGYGPTTIAYSYDAITWYPSTNGNTILSIRCNNIIWDGNIFIACGTGTNVLAYSIDGITWSSYDTSNSSSIFTTSCVLAINDTNEVTLDNIIINYTGNSNKVNGIYANTSNISSPMTMTNIIMNNIDVNITPNLTDTISDGISDGDYNAIYTNNTNSQIYNPKIQISNNFSSRTTGIYLRDSNSQIYNSNILVNSLNNTNYGIYSESLTDTEKLVEIYDGTINSTSNISNYSIYANDYYTIVCNSVNIQGTTLTSPLDARIICNDCYTFNSSQYNSSFQSLNSRGQNEQGSGTITIGDNAGALNSTGINNLIIGVAAGSNVTSASYNTILGSYSGSQITTANNNTLIGSFSGHSLTTGGYNTITGSNAGINMSTGFENIITGYNSGISMSNGFGNIMIGSECGESLTTGNLNVFIGQSSGIGTTTTDNNIFIGSYSGTDNNTGIDNTYVGYEAGMNNIIGNDNLLLGKQSGYTNMSNGIVSIGNYAGYYNSNGISNTYLGTNSGYYNTGDSNTYLGNNAGSSIGAGDGFTVTTASFNTVIGNEAGASLTTGSRNILIGSGSSNNTTSNIANDSAGGALTTGNDNIHIGVSAGYNSNSSINNVIIGSSVGTSILSSSDNVLIGKNTAASIETNGQNVIIGSGAGDSYTSNNAILIGYEAGVSYTGTEAFAIGYQAGSNVSGEFNMFMGYRSAGLPDANTTGECNIAIGPYSGFKLTNGSRNVILGSGSSNSSSGSELTSGSDNTLLGYKSGNAISIGDGNTLIGSNAGASLTTGTDNLILGYQTGYNLISGSNNVLLGPYSGFRLQTGDNNIHSGNNAGNKNISGSNNINIGKESGYKSTNNYNNIQLGYQAGYNSLADNNLFLGYQSGVNNKTGTNNIFIGKSTGAGKNSSKEQTGDNNIFVGTEAGTSNNNGYRNIFMGYNAGTSSISGSKNIFIGENAGSDGTTSHNIFIGTTTSDTTGIGYKSSNGADNNVFLGHDIGLQNTTGSDNIFIGDKAGKNNTTGTQNIYLGTNAGLNGNNVSSIYNIAIGSNVGINNNSGASNILIGKNVAGLQTSNNYNNNIILGTEAGQNIKQDNQIFIGTNAGQKNTLGNRNIFIGLDTGKSNIISNDNVIIGNKAGASSNGSGTIGANIIIGSNAGQDLLDGINNIFLGSNSAIIASNSINSIVIGSNAMSSGDSSNVIIIGQGAGNVNTAENNIFIGYESGYNNTIGINNLAIGFESLYNNINGNNNLSLGYESLYNNINGNDNISLGYQAGYNTGQTSNSSGNIFIGTLAGYTNDIGNNNIIIGTLAGSNVSSYSSNTICLGYQSGQYNTGEKNIFIGLYTGQANNADGNIFIGSGAGEYNTDGINNIFMGNGTGLQSITGSINSFIGSQAGFNNVIGNTNLFLGNYSGYYNNSGTNNIFMGVNSGFYNNSSNVNPELGNFNSYLGNYVGQSNNGNNNTFIGFELYPYGTDPLPYPDPILSEYSNKFTIYYNYGLAPIQSTSTTSNGGCNILVGGDFNTGTVGIGTLDPDSYIGSNITITDTKLVVLGKVLANNYTPFTGSHKVNIDNSIIIDTVNPLIEGMIMCSTGNVSYIDINNTVVSVVPSSFTNDKTVYGVYCGFEMNNVSNTNIYYVNALGEGGILISNYAGEIQNNDYITSCPIKGYGALQSDDFLHSYTVAKCTTNIDWSTISENVEYNGVMYKSLIVSCTYHCG